MVFLLVNVPDIWREAAKNYGVKHIDSLGQS
jgi:hypothetical protein